MQDWRGPAPARLQWRWRLEKPLSGGTAPADILTKAGDDAALKVCVMFDHALDRVPFVERSVLRIARSVSGDNLPAATVCYVWDSTYPAQTQAANPYTRRVRFITLQGVSAPLQRWVNESRETYDAPFAIRPGIVIPTGVHRWHLGQFQIGIAHPQLGEEVFDDEGEDPIDEGDFAAADVPESANAAALLSEDGQRFGHDLPLPGRGVSFGPQFRLDHIDRQNGPQPRRKGQGRMVIGAQIIPQPDQRVIGGKGR